MELAGGNPVVYNELMQSDVEVFLLKFEHHIKTSNNVK